MNQNKRVIVFVSDDNYVDHVKSLMANCVEQGKYNGDFAVICPAFSEVGKEFNNYGIQVLQVETNGFLQKFSIFDKFFKQWEELLYIDCDILIQDDLQRLFSLLQIEDKIWMDTEDQTTMETFWRDPAPLEHTGIYDYIKETYPDCLKQTFNSAFILFRPESIDEDTPQKLMEIQEKIKPVNDQTQGGSDQQVINLLLWDKCKKIPDKLVCFWGLAEPQNDEDSEYRQYKKGDIPVGIHHSRWYAPWIIKTPDMDDYLNRKLNTPNHELYQQNLELFYKYFKK